MSSDRDVKGKFLKGHKAVAKRDPETGCFISSAEFKYRQTSNEVNYFLDERQAG